MVEAKVTKFVTFEKDVLFSVTLFDPDTFAHVSVNFETEEAARAMLSAMVGNTNTMLLPMLVMDENEKGFEKRES